MKINRTQLKQIVRESIQQYLTETSINPKYSSVIFQLTMPIMNKDVDGFMKTFNSLDEGGKNAVYHYFADSGRIDQLFIQAMQNNMGVLNMNTLNEITDNNGYKLPGDETITDDDVVGINGNWKHGLRNEILHVKYGMQRIVNGDDGLNPLQIRQSLNNLSEQLSEICNKWLPVD